MSFVRELAVAVVRNVRSLRACLDVSSRGLLSRNVSSPTDATVYEFYL